MTTPHPSFDGLPGILQEIAEIAGIEVAMALADEVGGTRVDIPARAKPGDWLSKIVGHAAATKIAEHYRIVNADGRESGAYRVVIPLGPKSIMAKAKERLVRELEQGASPRVAARRAGMSERSAWRHLAKLKAGNRGELL